MLKKVSIYSVSKYAELCLHALVLLHFATTVGPAEYGETAASLLAITYSAFIVLGMNGSYVKYFCLAPDAKIRINLSNFCLISNLAASVIAFLLVCFFIAHDYALFVAAVCAFNLLKGAQQSILRANLYVNYLATLNILFSVLFAGIYSYTFLIAEQIGNRAFFLSWSLSLAITTVIGIYMLINTRLIDQFFAPDFVDFFKENFIKLFNNGVLLALLTFSSIFFVTSDRIIMIWLSIDTEVVGRYQFADSVTNIFYMGSSALLYLLTPFYTRRLNEQIITPEKFIKYGMIIGLAWSIALAVFLTLAYYGILIFSPQYLQGFNTVVLLGILKYALLFMFIPSTLYMTFHKEKTLLIIFFSLIPVTFFVQYYVSNVFSENVEQVLPLIALAGVLGVFFVSILRKQSYTSARNKFEE